MNAVNPRTPNGALYSLANFGTSLSSFVVSTYVGYFYIALVGLPPRWVGWGLFAFSWWNAFNDPFAGWLSDRTRTRWGRRTPYIALLALPLGLSFAAIWSPPLVGGSNGWLFTYLMSTITVNDLIYTLVAVNTAALLPEMFPSLRQRARANGWRQMMSLLGMLAGVLLAPMLAGWIGWRAMAFAVGAVVVVAILFSLRGIQEEVAFAVPSGRGPIGSLRETLRQRPFVIFLGLHFFVRLALTSINATMPFYASYVLRLGASAGAGLLAAAILSALLTMQLWGVVLARAGARTTMLVAQLATAVSVVPFLFAQTLPTALLASVLAGIGLAGLQITPEVMLSDVVDADHVRAGRRQEGIYFGANNFVTRLPNVLQAAGIGEMLALAGFDASLPVQPAGVIVGLRLMIGAIPAVALLLGSGLTWWYPMHGEMLVNIKREVARLRAETEAN